MVKSKDQTKKTKTKNNNTKKQNLLNTLSSFTFLMQYHRPTGKVATKMCKSKKKLNHVVGWCSETEAMMGIWIFAYPVSHKE